MAKHVWVSQKHGDLTGKQSNALLKAESAMKPHFPPVLRHRAPPDRPRFPARICVIAALCQDRVLMGLDLTPGRMARCCHPHRPTGMCRHATVREHFCKTRSPLLKFNSQSMGLHPWESPTLPQALRRTCCHTCNQPLLQSLIRDDTPPSATKSLCISAEA